MREKYVYQGFTTEILRRQQMRDAFQSISEIQLYVICSLHKISENQVKAVREWFPLYPEKC